MTMMMIMKIISDWQWLMKGKGRNEKTKATSMTMMPNDMNHLEYCHDCRWMDVYSFHLESQRMNKSENGDEDGEEQDCFLRSSFI